MLLTGERSLEGKLFKPLVLSALVRFLGLHCSLLALPGLQVLRGPFLPLHLAALAVALTLLVTPTTCHPKVSIKCQPRARHRVTGGQ